MGEGLRGQQVTYVLQDGVSCCKDGLESRLA